MLSHYFSIVFNYFVEAILPLLLVSQLFLGQAPVLGPMSFL
jgi:hypothetical protein